ncbi:prostaglandin E2 receptor EP3 subtype-like [Gastrophryne carolinensis]
MNNHTEACCENPFMSPVYIKSGKPAWVAFSLSMMTAGLVGNGLAITIIYRSYQKKENKRKHPFLLCVGGLVLTDFMGKLLTSPIVISVYLSDVQWNKVDPSGYLCQFFGVCITMFSLCPLLIASTMAIERTLAVYFPIWYSYNVGSKATGTAVTGILVASLGFSLLPLVGVGQYSVQWPGTWSFISMDQENFSTLFFATIYAFTGLLSLATTFICNLATIKALVSKCRSSHTGGQWGRIMTETLIQLLGITCVICVCWTPMLYIDSHRVIDHQLSPMIGLLLEELGRVIEVKMIKMIFSHMSTKRCMLATSMQSLELQEDCNNFLATVRLSCFNQIIDPWVYLLLKWVLSQKCCKVDSDV